MRKYGDKAKSYLGVQVWAKNNTKQDALFARDPASSSGWRDFSFRSSFGNIREWGFHPLVYLQDFEVYEEGRKRCKEFGIHLDKIALADAKPELSNKFRKVACNRYYNMRYDKIKHLSSKYGIDYFVVEKAQYNGADNKDFSKLPVAYENEHYTVYAVQSNK